MTNTIFHACAGWRLGLIGVGLASWLGGCATEPDVESPSWSSKANSVVLQSQAPGLAPLATDGVPVPDSDSSSVVAAIALLEEASASTNPLLRLNALEAVAPAANAASPIVRHGLADDNRAVRFGAAMIVGRKQLIELAPLVTPLLDDPSGSVRASAIFALRRCGQNVSLDPLAPLLLSDDPEVRANVAMIFGELGDPSALPLLREAVRRRPTRVPAPRMRIVDLQIAEAMVKLGADSELEAIRAALFAPEEQGELIALAAQISGRTGDQAYAAALFDMAIREGRDQEAPEIRLAALQAVAQMEPTRAPRQVAIDYLTSERFEIRVQAAMTLGWCRDRQDLPILSAMLRDPNPLVQVSAAGAILRITA